MTNSIHVLNGDAILPIFQNSGIKGELVIWREMLCDGPIVDEVASDDFWKNRYDFFEKELEISKLEYFDKTIKETLKLDDLAIYDEVVMWFEYDLFCQVNLLALCSYLLQNYRKDVIYNLVCVGRVKGKNSWQTLSDFTAEEYLNLYENRIKISKNNLIFANQAWKLYVQNNYKEIADFNFSKAGKFTYLQGAMNQHLKRFPSENGLNEIEQKILEIINSKPTTEQEIVGELLIWQHEHTMYGFSDVQYKMQLKKLERFYTFEAEKFSLNLKGKKLLTA